MRLLLIEDDPIFAAQLAEIIHARRFKVVIATEGREGLRGLPYAYLAAQRVGGADEAAWRARLEAGLAETRKSLQEPTSFSGLVLVSQGLMQSALGREAEARESFRRALLFPDQRLSHLAARRALAGARPF